MSYEVVVRTYFSIQHIQSAILFAKLAKNLETDYSNKLSEIEPKDRSGISAQQDKGTGVVSYTRQGDRCSVL